ncbi:MAG TPA: hypothetical protein PLM56_10835 [Cyclobacteriaceae bacterium]|jgi:hypothetical protein|nr:hypothetical protein [Cytophagales bacterium]HNT49282.1 hypothetical protein [Cyclobacteriaceae bacterium]HRE66012.1 hypothetical protein [Cyclobacteriaceae bacterium]HRF33984.1 hypothetical protein [Cyclobacteriaceae bacterium]
MKKFIYSLVALSAFACSGPKHTASFNNVNSTVPYYAAKSEVPTPINPEQMIASTASIPVVLATETPVAAQNTKEMVRKTYAQMTKEERKELRAELKSVIKTQKMNKKMGVESVSATKAMDNDLKLAAVFGAVGIVALIISGQVFYIIGGIALIIGVVFFVKWLVRQ